MGWAAASDEAAISGSAVPLLFLSQIQGQEAIYMLVAGLEGLQKSVNNKLKEYVNESCK